jgi:hypothetical protein
MNISEIERQLRAAPPEEDLYRVRALVLDADRSIPAERLVAPRLPSGALLGRGLGAALVGVLAVFLAGFALGRLAAPRSMSEGPAAPSSALLQPAFVSDELRRAFYSGVDRQHQWLVCALASSLTCADASAYLTNVVLGQSVSAFLSPVTVPAGHVVVGVELDPALPIAGYLSPADDPGAAGPMLAPAMIYPGDAFFDLGSLSPGRYVLSILANPTGPTMSGQIAIEIVVQ